MATVTDNAENISITIESSVELRCPREKENEELRREWAQEISGWNRPQFFTELTPKSKSGISAPDCQSIARLPVPQQQQQKVREVCFQLL